MHVRRALLLFAIILGLSALVASVAQPPRRDAPSTSQPTAGEPSRAADPRDRPPVVVRIPRSGRARARSTLPLGEPATVLIEVPEPGEVELAGLGLTSPAEPLTPARFELLPEEPGRHRVIFDAVGAAAPRWAATLVVRGGAASGSGRTP